MVYLQPCDWIELDHNFKYHVNVFGRLSDNRVAKVCLKGFEPYFYIKAHSSETSAIVYTSLEQATGKRLIGLKIENELKLDAMRGFNGLEPIRVWKLSFPALWMMKQVTRVLKNHCKIGSRVIETEDIYESNLPPYIRLFHKLDISPASPIEFEAEEEDPDEDTNVDVCFTIQYDAVKPNTTINIPLYALAYDLETYSDNGNFPVATNPSNEIMQIGMSFRYTNDLLKSIKRIVLVSGPCEESKDSDVKFISCKNEKDLLEQFQKTIHFENPDIIAGYNTFGFDDSYIADRAQQTKTHLMLGRMDTSPWKRDYAKTESKTFELASGKFAVRYLEVPGRLSIDLLLSIRREQNLDSYKLDNVSTVFLRDKITAVESIDDKHTQIFTKNTRGLFIGNMVRFDIVTNTVNPYMNGKKFVVTHIDKKSFIITHDVPVLADDVTDDEFDRLEWSFSKDDITAQEMWSSHTGTAAQRAKVAKYCVQDCDLVLTLMAKLDTIVNARGMADVCRVPIQYIFLRGQGIKIYSAVVYNASKRNQIIMTQENIEGDTSYEGAIVLPPKIGMYLDQPIPVLDFNSLYPSNMIAFNLSPDTLVYVKTFNADGRKIKQEGSNPDEIKALGYIIDEIGYDTKNDSGESTGRIICGFVQPKAEDSRTVGVLPLTLDILLKKRKETRKLMETTEDDSQKSVLNGLQLAYKVVANSVYGQAGSRTSPIRRLEVAACTTALGRARIYEAKTIVENDFGATVIYGDSVAGYTPVITRQNGKIQISSIEELCEHHTWKQCLDSEKEYCQLEKVDSWTENGWTPISRVIRHTLASHKKMIRVLTHTGLVDVTDDHSLLTFDKKEVSPKELSVGDLLLHSAYPVPEVHEEYNANKARIAGFFMGDGSCGSYECLSGNKASWALNNANPDLLAFYQNLCTIEYPDFEWIVNPTLESSGVFKLCPKSSKYGSIKDFVKTYRSIMYVNNRKNIPLFILNGTLEIQRAFWNGLCDADGDKDIRGYTRIDQKYQTTAAQIAFLAERIGFKTSINTRSDKPNVYRITCTENTQRKNTFAIKKIHEIEYSGYVYDLTTESHHFQAGIGHMIVHNTDSIFVQFPSKNLEESIEMGKRAAEKITSLCRRPYKIEYEKTFYPFILFCRKRYVGMMYEDDITKCKRKTMGIALKRRDNAPIVKDVFGGALDILLEKRDIRAAQTFVKEMLVRVMKNEIPIEKYIVTKQLRDDYKNPEQIAHRVLADRMEERDKGTAPQVGDRVPYVYVSNRSDAKKQGDKIEHVDYVKAKCLKPDTEFYITNQIQNPVAQLFALAIEDLEGYKPRVDYAKLYRELLEKGTDEEEATLAILKRKEKELESILFMGASYLTRHKRGAMDAFVIRK